MLRSKSEQLPNWETVFFGRQRRARECFGNSNFRIHRISRHDGCWADQWGEVSFFGAEIARSDLLA